MSNYPQRNTLGRELGRGLPRVHTLKETGAALGGVSPRTVQRIERQALAKLAEAARAAEEISDLRSQISEVIVRYHGRYGIRFSLERYCYGYELVRDEEATRFGSRDEAWAMAQSHGLFLAELEFEVLAHGHLQHSGAEGMLKHEHRTHAEA